MPDCHDWDRDSHRFSRSRQLKRRSILSFRQVLVFPRVVTVDFTDRLIGFRPSIHPSVRLSVPDCNGKRGIAVGTTGPQQQAPDCSDLNNTQPQCTSNNAQPQAESQPQKHKHKHNHKNTTNNTTNTQTQNHKHNHTTSDTQTKSNKHTLGPADRNC